MVRWRDFKKTPHKEALTYNACLMGRLTRFTYYIYRIHILYIYKVRLLLIWQRNLEHRVVGMLLLDYVDELLDDFGMLV